MVAEGNYMDRKRALQSEILEMGNLTQDQWDEAAQKRWVDKNREFDELVAEHDQQQQQAEQLAQRDERLQQLKEAARDYHRFADRQLPPAPAEHRHEYRWCLAMQGYMTDNPAIKTSDHQEAMRTFGYRRGEIGLNLRPYQTPEGLQCWSRRNGITTHVLDKTYQQLEDVEKRAITVGGSPGSEFVPQGFQRELERAMLDFGGVQNIARMWQTSGVNPIPWPTINDTAQANEATQVAENATLLPDVDPSTGVVTFNAYKFRSPPVFATQEQIEDSAFNIPTLVASLLGERLARGTNRSFINDNGVNKPEGVLTGVTTLGHTTGGPDPDYDDWVTFVHSVDPSYRRMSSAGFLFNDDTLLSVRLVKDSQGRPLWQPGMEMSEPDRIFGFPYQVDQHMPDRGTGVKYAIFGDWSKFVIRRHASIRFHRLVELYRLSNDSDAFVSLMRVDSHVVDAGTNPLKYMTAPA